MHGHTHNDRARRAGITLVELSVTLVVVAVIAVSLVRTVDALARESRSVADSLVSIEQQRNLFDRLWRSLAGATTSSGATPTQAVASPFPAQGNALEFWTIQDAVDPITGATQQTTVGPIQLYVNDADNVVMVAPSETRVVARGVPQLTFTVHASGVVEASGTIEVTGAVTEQIRFRFAPFSR